MIFDTILSIATLNKKKKSTLWHLPLWLICVFKSLSVFELHETFTTAHTQHAYIYFSDYLLCFMNVLSRDCWFFQPSLFPAVMVRSGFWVAVWPFGLRRGRLELKVSFQVHIGESWLTLPRPRMKKMHDKKKKICVACQGILKLNYD